MLRVFLIALAFPSWLAASACLFVPFTLAVARPIGVEDVLALERLDRVSVSPDGGLVAAVVIRGVADGEVYGRTFHELDPSRADVFIIDRERAESRNITNGRAFAAGAWCATWSPDGTRLAILSTRPEGSEPRGGDNVRLYIWERGSGALRRLGEWAVMTQTRSGGTIHKLDLAGPGQAAPDPCARGDENPPFVWLDSRRLLVAALPSGHVSGLLDETDRTYSRAAATRRRLRAGQSAVVSASGSGTERTSMDPLENVAMLTVVDVQTGRRSDVGEIPTYPFHGSLGVRVSKDGKQAVVLATTSMVPFRADAPIPSLDGEWLVKKQLGIVTLGARQSVRWLRLPSSASLPLQLGGWRANRSALTFTARARDDDAEPQIFDLDLANEAILPGAPLVVPSKVSQPSDLPPAATLVAKDARGLIWQEATPTGIYLRALDRSSGTPRDLLALSTHMADIDLGETRVIDYRSADGVSLKAIVLLPPHYRAGSRLPIITWVYGGYIVRGADDYFTDPYMPGLYNLRLYAARGYAVLIPSIPLKRDGSENHLEQLEPAVLPALDRLVKLGIADPDRVGVMGQSYGGYTTLGLIAQTRRFRAAVALASISDLTALVGEFDPTAAGFGGIEHEKSANMPIAEVGSAGLRQSFPAAPDLYQAASPLSYVGRVKTPVLLIHGEDDIRGSAYQSEAFFSALWRQGKTARLLRYPGENHALHLSPATVRSVVEEITQWFDKYLATPNTAPTN